MSIDDTPTANSNNLVKSGGVKSYVDNAIPSVPVQDVTVGGSSVVSNGTAVVPAIPTVPTISTNLFSDKADNTKTAGAKVTYDEIHPAIESSQPAGGLRPNVLYNLGTLTGSVTISLATPDDANVANEYMLTFTAGSTAPTITWPNSITGWVGSCVDNGAPEITGGNYYEVSILGGIGVILELES